MIINEEQEKRIKENLTYLLDLKDTNNLIRISIRDILPTKNKFAIYLIVSVFLICFSTVSCFSESTVSIFKGVIEVVNVIYLAVLAVMITAFALFQAIVSGQVTLVLLSMNSNIKKGRSKLSDYNMHMMGLIYYYIIFIIINTILLLFSLITPDDFHIFFISNIINNLIATVLTYIYLLIFFHGLIELLAFIFHLYSAINSKDFIEAQIEMLNNKRQE